ncbi:MAG: hypothetical protein KIS66_16830 [Fimbriimonadaceae bacterium]|nr:hypothetical protein [Fimbriimonadaceae bacterium]
MKRQHNHHEEPLIAWVFDEGPKPEAMSERDALRSEQFVRMASALRAGFYDAPDHSVERAEAVFPVARRILPKAFGLGLAGARGLAATAFQVMYEAEDVTVRVGYEREGQGWRVLGEGPAGAWVELPDRDLEPDEGRFEFEAASLNGTGFVLRLSDREIPIPPGSEATHDESR